jgi:hypothetical protein
MLAGRVDVRRATRHRLAWRTRERVGFVTVVAVSGVAGSLVRCRGHRGDRRDDRNQSGLMDRRAA